MDPRYKVLGGKPYQRYVQLNERFPVQPSETKAAPAENTTHGTYGALLFDPRWRARRLEILQRDGHRCIICQGNVDLQVHHRQYHFLTANQQFKPPWDYPDNLMITICEPCHKRGHNLYKVPTINI